MPIDDKVVLRYVKVKAIADDPGTTPGERDAARQQLTGMENKYEGIAKAASAYIKSNPDASPTQPPPNPTPQSHVTPTWADILKQATGFARTVEQVINDVSAVYQGQALAEETVQFSSRFVKDNLHISIKIPVGAIEEARSLNSIQQRAFRDVVLTVLEDYLDTLLSADENM